MNAEQMLIWKYLDGECTEAERKALEARYFTDALFKQEWERCKALHEELQRQELEQPSMRFQTNLLERVFQNLPARPVQELLPKSAVRWLAGLGSAAVALLGWAAVFVSPAANSNSQLDRVVDSAVTKFLNLVPYSTLLTLLLVTATLLVLYLADKGLTRLRRAKY